MGNATKLNEATIRRRIHVLEEALRMAKEALDSGLKELQERCPHDSMQHHIDVYDNYYSCPCCGGSWCKDPR